MEQERNADIRHDIAEALFVGAALMVRQLAWGTSLTCRSVLATLGDSSPVRLTALAAATGVSQPAMTQLVRRLEREGLVTRLIDPEDARATLVAISDAGTALRAELHNSLDERLVELLSTLSPDEEAALGLAMRVTLPLLHQLTRHAATGTVHPSHRDHLPAPR